jgi:hypothetical protein
MPVIELYEVAPEDDEAFLAAWLADGNGVLLRAVRDDAEVRYVSIAPGDGDYELVHEEGEVDAPGGVILIAASATPPGTFAGHRGYLGMRVYSGPGKVTVARWSSPLMIQRAGAPYLALYQPVLGALP